jgi:hypothetical protein
VDLTHALPGLKERVVKGIKNIVCKKIAIKDDGHHQKDLQTFEKKIIIC